MDDFDLQQLLTFGITAYAETQQARYAANDPTPNARGATQQTAPVGEPAFNPTVAPNASGLDGKTLLIIGVIALLLWQGAK